MMWDGVGMFNASHNGGLFFENPGAVARTSCGACVILKPEQPDSQARGMLACHCIRSTPHLQGLAEPFLVLFATSVLSFVSPESVSTKNPQYDYSIMPLTMCGIFSASANMHHFLPWVDVSNSAVRCKAPPHAACNPTYSVIHSDLQGQL
jgi:hypothetical protein